MFKKTKMAGEQKDRGKKRFLEVGSSYFVFAQLVDKRSRELRFLNAAGDLWLHNIYGYDVLEKSGVYPKK